MTLWLGYACARERRPKEARKPVWKAGPYSTSYRNSINNENNIGHVTGVVECYSELPKHDSLVKVGERLAARRRVDVQTKRLVERVVLIGAT